VYLHANVSGKQRMKKQKKILILIAFLIAFSFSELFAQTKNWKEIETAFIKLDSLNNETLNCKFEFKNLNGGMTPDVDVFDKDHKHISDEITKENVVSLIKYYAQYCEKFKIDDQKKEEFKKIIIEFLKYENYSIQMDYKESEGRTESLICLIYYENAQYLLFWIENRDK